MMGYYPKHRGRRRKYKALKPWEVVHRSLAHILNDVSYHVTDKDYAKMVYFGNREMLEKECIKILNALSRIKEMEECKN